MGLEADIREIATDMRWVREHLEAGDERFEKIEARITQLDERQDKAESDARVTRAWAAGAAAAMAFLATTLKDWAVPILKGLLATIAVVYLLTGTAGCAETQVMAKWHGPVEYVINADMHDDCVVAAQEAARFWEGQGVDYLYVKAADGGWEGFSSCPDNMICVTAGEQDDTAGLTWQRTWQASPHWMASADIELNQRECFGTPGIRAATHELGHGLGLEDIHDNDLLGNVMFWWLGGVGHKLEPWQLDHVKSR